MSLLITSYFSSSGSPATGLTPTITVRDLSDNSVVVNAQSMTEVGSGYYKYTYAGYDSTKNYVALCDGGITLVGGERYTIADTGDSGEISGIKVKTDGLNFDGSYVQSQVKAQDNIDFGALQKSSLNAATPSVTVSDKSGFSLSSTGADLILKSSTFVQAIVAAINEFATYGLTALNYLLVTTGIKAASVPNVTLANGAHGGASTTITLQTPIEANVASETNHDFTALQKTSLNAATPASVQNIPADGSGFTTLATAANLAVVDGNVDDIKSLLNATDVVEWTYTLTDFDTGLPLSGIEIMLTTDAAGYNVKRVANTNLVGVATFYFAAIDVNATVYAWANPQDYNPLVADEEIISANGSGTVVSIVTAAPGTPVTSETRHQIESAIIPLTIRQGASFYRKWDIMYDADNEPFPLFSPTGVALYKMRCRFRENYGDSSNLLSLLSSTGGVEMTWVDGSPPTASYAILLSAVQTATLPIENCVYDIEAERLSDGWIVGLQEGQVTIKAEVAK